MRGSKEQEAMANMATNQLSANAAYTATPCDHLRNTAHTQLAMQPHRRNGLQGNLAARDALVSYSRESLSEQMDWLMMQGKARRRTCKLQSETPSAAPAVRLMETWGLGRKSA